MCVYVLEEAFCQLWIVSICDQVVLKRKKKTTDLRFFFQVSWISVTECNQMG